MLALVRALLLIASASINLIHGSKRFQVSIAFDSLSSSVALLW